MTEQEMLDQLNSLIADRKSFITDNNEMNEVFINDIVALNLIINKYKELKSKYERKRIDYENLICLYGDVNER